MAQRFFRHRPGTTLVELVMFLAFFATISGILITILVRTSEIRIRQQVIADVDLTGIQMLHTVARQIRRAERILDPSLGASGSILALQMGDLEDTPAVIGVQSGALQIAEYETLYTLSPSTITVSDFSVYNTSPSADRQSVLVSFRVSRVAAGITFAYERSLQTVVTLFPDDVTQGDACGCDAPVCSDGVYSWHVCEEDLCRDAEITFVCPE